MDPVIEVNDLQKKFNGFVAVKGINFSVQPGEIFGFLGPNGAGKSTTINVLSTVLRPSGGQARINGFDVVRSRNAVRGSIGIIFQENTLDDKLTANENLLLHCKFYQVAKNVREERIREVLNIVDLADKRHQIVQTFSGGMKRRLEIARGLLHYPKVLFLDEPTAGLDPQTRDHIWSYILKLKEKAGITIFLTTHYMDEAEICDRIAVIDHGELIALDTPEHLKNQLGGDIMEIATADNKLAQKQILAHYGKTATEKDGLLSFQVKKGNEFLIQFVREFTVPLHSVNLRRPTLNDVFLSLTGREIREEQVSQRELMKRQMLERGH